MPKNVQEDLFFNEHEVFYQLKELNRVLYSYLTRYVKYIKFIIVGGLNAGIYFAILMTFIELTDDYYLSVGLSQVAIAVIAYVTFSHLHFKSKLELKIFIKFAISNILLFLASSGIVWITNANGMQLRPELFGIIVVFIIAPLSYIFNTYFVFNNAKSSVFRGVR